MRKAKDGNLINNDQWYEFIHDIRISLKLIQVLADTELKCKKTVSNIE